MTLTTRPGAEPAPPARRPGIRAILTPGWIAIILVALAFAGACWFVLAPWQFNRHTERDAQNAQIEAALNAPAVPVTELLTLAAEPPADAEFRTVTATGSFSAAEQVYVRLRQNNEASAHEVVVPFVITDGTRILVDRGYIADTDLSAGRLPPDLPRDQVTITGRVSADQPDPLNRPESPVDGRREVTGIESSTLLGSASGARLGFIQLTSASPAVLTEIGVPDRDSGPFLSYALQWLVFGVVALLAAGVFAYREVTEGPAVAESTAPAPATPPVPDGRRRKFDKSELYD